MLTGNTDVSTPGLVTFGSTVNGTVAGSQSLTVSNGDASFADTVGAGTSLSSLAVNGATSLGGNVTTTGAQTYTGAVTLAANVTATIMSSSMSVLSGTVGYRSANTVRPVGALSSCRQT